jgi:hypothetical protein
MEMVMNKFEKSKKPSSVIQGGKYFVLFQIVALEARTKTKSMTIE